MLYWEWVSVLDRIARNIIRRPGGLHIKRGGEVEGAIGVSGAPTDKQDEECARHGIEAIG